MSRLPIVDLVVLVVYVLAVVVLGSTFVRRSRTAATFTAAGGALPGWAVGLSLFGTFLSSNTFLGVPGKAYAEDWNAFVFSLSLPLAAWIAARWFVPFYRRGGEISAYTHLERRFGRWARIYAMVCYLLTQLARIGAILFGVALALGALTGWPAWAIIVSTGLLVTVYTLLGGIEAVIWTDVVQSVVLTAGALLAFGLLLFGMPEGPGQLFELAMGAGKTSLGSFELDFTRSTFWVVLCYGLFINLNNFGIDQSFVQRYHAARSDRQAAGSVWLAAALYLPISLLFFLVGSGLWAYHQTHPELRADLERQVLASAAAVPTGGDEPAAVGESETAAERLDDVALGDRAFPHFIVQKLPVGVSGLLIAALLAAAMSSVDTSLNSSATVILEDIWRGGIRRGALVSESESLAVLHGGTLLVGALGTGAALAMIGTTSVLDTWWTLSGVFAGGMLGLFLLGVASRARRPEALLAVIVGVLVILWLTLSPRLPEAWQAWRNPLHANMTIVVGTLTLFLVGVLAARLRRVGEGTERGAST